MIGEIERQMRSLHRQAKKAERFRQYRDEAFEIGIRLTAEDCRNLELERTQHIALAEQLNQKLVDAVVAVQNLETQRTNAQLAVKKATDEVEQAARDLRMVEEKGLLARERRQVTAENGMHLPLNCTAPRLTLKPVKGEEVNWRQNAKKPPRV